MTLADDILARVDRCEKYFAEIADYDPEPPEEGPVQYLVRRNAALEKRFAILEQSVIELRALIEIPDTATKSCVRCGNVRLARLAVGRYVNLCMYCADDSDDPVPR